MARTTLPDFKHLVQTRTRSGVFPRNMRTRCKFAFHARLVFRLEWLTLFPVVVLAHMAHCLAMRHVLPTLLSDFLSAHSPDSSMDTDPSPVS